MSLHTDTTYVLFAETGKTRKVKRDCRKCVPGGQWRIGHWVVSPRGLTHVVLTGEHRTLCGKDAEKETWWWAE